MLRLQIILKHRRPLQSQWTGKTSKLCSHMSQEVNYLQQVYIFRALSEQRGHFIKIKTHKTEKITMKAHYMHHNMVRRVLMNNHVFASPTGTYTTENVCYRHKWLWYIFAASKTAWIFWQGGIPYSENSTKVTYKEVQFFVFHSLVSETLWQLAFRYTKCNDRKKFLAEWRDSVDNMWRIL
jgi:hypothetical protein